MPNSTVRARVRYRDDDGRKRRVQATGTTRKAAQYRLKEKLNERRGHGARFGDLTPDSSFGRLVEVWLEDLDLEGKIAPTTQALLERNIRQLVMPTFAR